MQKYFILAHDVGTTGDKACIYSEKGQLLASSYQPYQTFYGKGGRVEQRPEDWYRAFCLSTKKVLEEAAVEPAKIAGLSFSGHMMGCVPVDREGKLTREQSFLWADVRSKEEGKRLLNTMGYEEFYNITGGGLDIETYPAVKIPWLKRHEPEVFKRTYKFLGTKDYLVLKLTGSFVTDYSDASDTGLLDLEKGKWSEEILRAAEIPPGVMPELRESCAVVGKVSERASTETGLTAGTPVVLGGGDVPCAALGAGAVNEGSSHACIGSAAWLSVTSKRPLYDLEKRPFLLAHLRPGYYVSQMAMYSAGIAFQWFKENLCQNEVRAAESAGVSPYDLLCLKAEGVPAGSEKLLFLPFLRGGGAPYYNLNDSGVYLGLRLTHKKEHLVRALMEGVAFNLKSIFKILNRQAEVNQLRLIGGGSRSRLWRQIICDVLGIKVMGCHVTQEANSLGAAINAAVGIGLYDSYQAAADLVKIAQVHQPEADMIDKYDQLYPIFTAGYETLTETFDRLAELQI